MMVPRIANASSKMSLTCHKPGSSLLFTYEGDCWNCLDLVDTSETINCAPGCFYYWALLALPLTGFQKPLGH